MWMVCREGNSYGPDSKVQSFLLLTWDLEKDLDKKMNIVCDFDDTSGGSYHGSVTANFEMLNNFMLRRNKSVVMIYLKI
jgi:hypothetical protein